MATYTGGMYVGELLRRYDVSKLLAGGVFGLYFLYALLTPESWHFIDTVDLIIHEAGHPLFGLFGEWVGILGGSLMQLLVPLAFVGYFLVRYDLFAAGVVGMWLAQSLTNVSVYVGDAAKMALSLLGGEAVIHDWNYLLSSIGLLDHATLLSNLVHAAAFVVFSASVWCVLLGARKKHTW